MPAAFSKQVLHINKNQITEREAAMRAKGLRAFRRFAYLRWQPSSSVVVDRQDRARWQPCWPFDREAIKQRRDSSQLQAGAKILPDERFESTC